MSARKTYRIYKADLILVGTDNILIELKGHLVKDANVEFPDTFYVSIDIDGKVSDDTNGILYEKEPNKHPFMMMGYSDTSYFTTVALFRAIGTLIT